MKKISPQFGFLVTSHMGVFASQCLLWFAAVCLNFGFVFCVSCSLLKLLVLFYFHLNSGLVLLNLCVSLTVSYTCFLLILILESHQKSIINCRMNNGFSRIRQSECIFRSSEFDAFFFVEVWYFKQVSESALLRFLSQTFPFLQWTFVFSIIVLSVLL